MGKDYWYWPTSSSSSSSSSSKPSATSGCMSALFHTFDFHPFHHFSINQQQHKPPSSSSTIFISQSLSKEEHYSNQNKQKHIDKDKIRELFK
ncbi:hypothetical protein PIB30_102984 [Stylosanthes scabra]|uniref:Uncharacterized protein n=1 Tax=Stylosanthes scabra TaxID=79078 RepID=A0ABU6WXI5_9FABA|nr:hypothetical protein [Stylosanthes scabra]